VDKDTLKICVNKDTDGAKERPLKFETEGKPNWRLMVFKRQKDIKGDGTEGLNGFIGVAIKFEKDDNKLVIADVLKDSPAKKAGLKKDDVLLKGGGSDPTSLLQAIDLIRETKPGGQVTLRIKRGEKEQDITVKAGVVPFMLLD